MKKIIEANDLLQISEEIQHSAVMLELTDAECTEDDLAFYLPVIRQCADNLRQIAEESKPAQNDV